MCLWQYSLIGRNDDICHFEATDPKGHPIYNFALMTKVRWSKNIAEERGCPDQILLGSMDHSMCLLISLSIYPETFLAQHLMAYYLFTEDTALNAVKRLKNRYSKRLTNFVWKSDELQSTILQQDEGQGVRTHSQRKFPATYAKRQGCTTEEIEIRGRWKQTNGKIVHRYIDVKQEFIDAKVASKLCIGGPVKYSLKKGVEGITHEWIYTHVVPSIRSRFENDNRLCYVLGLSLLYAAMTEGDKQILVPELIRRRIRFAYHQLGQDELQPVQKIPLLVQRKDDQLDINEYIEIDGLSQVGMIDGSVAHMVYS